MKGGKERTGAGRCRRYLRHNRGLVWACNHLCQHTQVQEAAIRSSSIRSGYDKALSK